MSLRASSGFGDTRNGYGWLSIALHWITAIVVLALLFVGSSIASDDAARRAEMILAHTTIAVTCYALLWYRVVWRFVKGHPGPLPTQRSAFFVIGKYVHLATLAAIACMLISGPLMVWSGGEAIGVGGWFEIPSPLEPRLALRDFLHTVHRTGAIIIVTGVLLHIGGVYKHAAFDQDGTFGKMLIAARPEHGSRQAAAPTRDGTAREAAQR